MLSAYYRNYNMNVSNFYNWTGGGSSNIYTNLAFGAKIGRRMNLRPSAQYSYTTKKWISIKAELEERISKNSQLSLRYENSLIAKYNSINVTFRYDLPYMSTYLASGLNNKKFQASESARGSLAFGSGNNYVHFDKSSSVGRSGIAVETFVDVNFNDVHDKGEPYAERIKMSCSGGQPLIRDKDSIMRVTGLEPFVEYTIILDESGFQNLAWRLKYKSIKVVSDPNQFKLISIPVHPMGEVTGSVVRDDAGSTGIGRILVNVWNKNGGLVTKVLTESDGFFTYLGLTPGEYTVGIDSMQLNILKFKAEPVPVTVKESVQGDIVDAGTIVLERIPGTEIAEEKVIEKQVIKEPETIKTIIPVVKTKTEKAEGLSVVKIVPLSMEIAVIYYNDGSYCLQLGAYKAMPFAEKLSNKIKRVLPDINIELVEENKIIKVRTERVTSRIEAIRLARRIQSAGLLE